MNEIKKPYKYVGTNQIRPDGVPKVTGTAKFGNDYTLPGTLYGKILRSPYAHALIKSIDTSKAPRTITYRHRPLHQLRPQVG